MIIPLPPPPRTRTASFRAAPAIEAPIRSAWRGRAATMRALLCVLPLVAPVAAHAQTGSALAGPVQPAPTQALPPWTVPDPNTLPDDAFGRSVRHGRDLIVKTSSLIGPDAPNPTMRFAGNGLDCQSCHLNAGTQRFGLPLAGIWGVFPTYIARENQVRTLEERINGCMERSMNGRALPVDGAEMKAMLTYIRFISAGEPVGQALVGRGAPKLPMPEQALDPAHGKVVFNQYCAACHGADGQGQRLSPQQAKETGRRYTFPPLWGPDSFNDCAGMSRAITAAEFIHANMPLGTTYQAPQISAADAFNVAGFILSQPRPHKPDLQADFPDLWRKPPDAAYPPFLGPFTVAQHQFGPWGPIEAWLRSNKAASKE